MRLTEFLGQFDVATTGYSTGIKWHLLTEEPIYTYVGFDNLNFYIFFDCDTHLDSTWLQVSNDLFKRGNTGPTGSQGLTLRFDQGFRDRFAPFLLELIEQCEIGDDPDDRLSEVLPRWFIFWDEPLPLLDVSKQVQLFGELEILSKLIPEIGIRALDTWRSPHNSDDLHDWQGQEIHLEAKVTASRPRRIHISTIDQMDPTTAAHDNLVLIIVELDRMDSAPNLSDKVSELRGIAREHNCETRLEELLALFGYLDRHGPMYGDGFEIAALLYLEIGPLTEIYTSRHLTENYDEHVKKITQTVDYQRIGMQTICSDVWNNLSNQL